MPECRVPQYFRTEQVVASGRRRLEPDLHVAPGNDVGLHAKCRHEPVVDDVFRRRDQPDGAAGGNMQLVDLTLAVEMLELPHPLLPDDIDVDARRPAGRDIAIVQARAPDEDHHRDHERNHGPRELEDEVAVRLRADRARGAAAKLQRRNT